MNRLFCILALLSLALAPAARAMDHSHHQGPEMQQERPGVGDTHHPIALACDAVNTTDAPMPGHGSCLGCCPDKHVQGNVSLAPRMQDILPHPDRAEFPALSSGYAPLITGARSPGLVCGDYCPILRL